MSIPKILPKVLVTGANGILGYPLVRALNA